MKGTIARRILGLALAGALTVGAVDVAQAAVVVKATASNTWSPKKTSISKGTKVVWTNPTSINHTMTAYGGGWSKSVVLSPGDRTSFTFTSKRVFKFRCRYHSTVTNGVCSGMCGKIVVG